jgi:hypothetical protein
MSEGRLDVRTRREATQTSLRLALTPNEAAVALGCSRDFFDEHIGPELRSVRRGRLKFVAIFELEDWLRRSAALTLERER